MGAIERVDVENKCGPRVSVRWIALQEKTGRVQAVRILSIGGIEDLFESQM